MRRFLIALFPILLGQCVDGSMPGMATPTESRRLTIQSTPVLLDSSNPDRRRVGALTFLGGWSLTSDTRGFGAISALNVDGRLVTALSDNGTITQLRFGRFGNVSEAENFAVPDSCGKLVHKYDNDTEGLTRDSETGRWWISYEWRNGICRLDESFAGAEAIAQPRAIAAWPKKKGPETILRLVDGRFLLIAEDVKEGDDPVRAVLFDRDPTDPAAVASSFSYRPPDGYKPTDAAQLPDGRILVLNRRFSIPALFTSKITIVPAIGETPPEILEGKVIATLAPPLVADNFEGISVTIERGRPIIWLASDDNFMRWQRTLLLKFGLN
jgi:hypothetical protein